MLKKLSIALLAATAFAGGPSAPAVAQDYGHNYTQSDDSYYRDCEQQRENNEVAGAVVGSVLGGLAGNAIGRHGGRGGATIAGVIIGGAVGTQIGRNLSCDDRHYAYAAYGEGLDGEPGQKYVWHNDADGDHGYIVPGDYYHDHDGFECRDFHQVMVVHDDRSEMDGTACRQNDGTWAVVR